MSRFTLMAFAVVCILGCASYAQDAQNKPQPTSSTPSAKSQSSAPAGAAQPAPPMAAPPAPPATPPPHVVPDTSVVPLTEPVLTLKGACKPEAGSTKPPEGCVSGVTREQFEKMIKALSQPDRPMPPDLMRNFATQYAKLLTFSDAARAMGLENSPQVQQIMQFVKNQVLTEALNRQITEEFAHPTDQQIEDYYKQNSKKYLEVTLQRIIIPHGQVVADKPKPSDADEKAYAEQIDKRWVAGEDPEKLEKEATEHANISTPPANVNIGPRTPGTLPEAHESVFDLKPGEVSQVFADPASFYIYKVVSVRQIPLSEVKAKISTTLSRQLVADKIQEIQGSVTPVFNDTYFGPERPAVNPAPRVIAPRRPGPPPPGAAGTPTPGNAPPPPQAPPQ